MAPTREGEKRRAGRIPKTVKATVRPSTQAHQSDRSQKQGPEHLNTDKAHRKEGTQTGAATRIARSPPTQTSSRKRKAAQIEGDEQETGKSSGPNYTHLAHRVRRIPQDIVTSKWKTPSQPVQDQVRDIFTFATRSVILSRGDKQERAEAELLLSRISRKLEKRVSRMLLPPEAKRLHFDLDQLRDRNVMLESELTPAKHSIDLLKTEMDRAEMELGHKKRNVAELEANIKSSKLQKSLQDQPHPLLRLTKGFKMSGDGPEDIGLRPLKAPDTSLLNTPDPELAPLIQQLRRGLESMRDNHTQVQGVQDAVRRARVELDDVLFAHASSGQYRAVQALV